MKTAHQSYMLPPQSEMQIYCVDYHTRQTASFFGKPEYISHYFKEVPPIGCLSFELSSSLKETSITELQNKIKTYQWNKREQVNFTFGLNGDQQTLDGVVKRNSIQ